jgi:hypothetical protein
VELGVDAEAEPALEFAFEVDEDFLVLLFQAVEHVGVEHHAHFAHAGVQLHHAGQRALDFHAHGFGALDDPLPLARRAFHVDRAADAFLHALARHFHQAELRDGQDMRPGLVALDVVLEEG